MSCFRLCWLNLCNIVKLIDDVQRGDGRLASTPSLLYRLSSKSWFHTSMCNFHFEPNHLNSHLEQYYSRIHPIVNRKTSWWYNYGSMTVGATNITARISLPIWLPTHPACPTIWPWRLSLPCSLDSLDHKWHLGTNIEFPKDVPDWYYAFRGLGTR